jgi:Right handed beta helix region
VGVEDAGDRVEHMRIRNCGVGLPFSDSRGSGIVLHTASSNAVVTRNWVSDVGAAGCGSNCLKHGIYIQGNGHTITNNLFSNILGGYGIHLYPSSSNVVVAQNTAVTSQSRSGIVINTTGGNNKVVNNVFALNATYGMSDLACGSGCLVDHNLTWGNTSGDYEGFAPTNPILGNPLFADSEYRVGVGSAAINSARPDYSYSPDRDGHSRPLLLTSVDVGAYEWH